jgi:hypothetical protein
MYNLSAYYIARTFADIPAELINTLLFVVIAYWFGGLKHDAGSFFGLLFRCACLSQTCWWLPLVAKHVPSPCAWAVALNSTGAKPMSRLFGRQAGNNSLLP